MNDTIKESVLHALGRGQELTLGEVTRSVCNDYGTISSRTVLRYLDQLTDDKCVERTGVRGHFIYTRSRIVKAG